MKYDIYFHNDFDGRASAAVMLAFLRSRGDEIEHFTPVDFDLQKAWLDERFFEKHKFFKGKRNPAIVVDFPYHPKAAWWFDHHETPFKKESWRKDFKPDKFRRYEPKYWSACHFVVVALHEGFGWKPPKHFTELVKWLDIIDGARYKSVKQTLIIKDAGVQVDHFIDKTAHDTPGAKWMVEQLSKRPVKEIARLPKIRKVVAAEQKEITKSLAWYRKNMKLIGTVSFIDNLHNPWRTLRYASYYLYPKAKYAVRFERKGVLYHIGVGMNPWGGFKKAINIGGLLKKYGGGGHAGAGAVDFDLRRDAEKATEEIIDALNRKQ